MIINIYTVPFQADAKRIDMKIITTNEMQKTNGWKTIKEKDNL